MSNQANDSNVDTSSHLLTGESMVSSGRAARSFWQLMLGTSLLACITHVAFFFLFYLNDVTALAAVNLGSVVLYAVTCFLLIRRIALFLALDLLLFEVLGHAVLASYWIGWDSGFYYYAILTIPVLIVSDLKRIQTKVVAVVGNIVLMLGMDVLLRNGDPYYDLPGYVLDGLHYFNLTVCLVILTFLVGTYFRLVTRAETELRLLASTDPLTRLLNRRSMVSAFKFERVLQQSAGNGLSLILCDIDHFKRINDTYGHDVGDYVLQAVSTELSNNVRKSDHVARWGGEEFMILLVGTRGDQARALAETLRNAVAELQIPIDSPDGHATLHVTLTLGVSEMQPNSTEPLEDAIARADTALYKGKHAGRNCVESTALRQAAPA